MKYRIFILVFLFSPIVKALSCLELQKDLIALDYKLNTLSCADSDDKNCNFNRGYNILLQKKNAAVAELIIQEGIMAIKNSVIDNNNQLAFLQDIDLQQIKNSHHDLIIGLDKSELIEFAVDEELLSSKGNMKTSPWSPLKVEEEKLQTLDSFTQFIDTRFCIENAESKLCNKLNDIPEGERRSELVDTLRGFIIADRKVMKRESQSSIVVDNYKESDVSTRYKNYRGKWKYYSNDDYKNITSTEIRTLLQDGIQLNGLIEKYESNPTEQNARLLLDATKALEPLKINYQELSESNQGETDKFLDDKIRNLVFNSHLGQSGLKGLILDKNLNESILKQIEIAKKTKNFFESQIKSQDSITKTNTAEIELISHEDHLKKLKRSKSCLEKSDYKKKVQCLEKVKSSLSNESDLAILKNNVIELNKKIEAVNQMKPFKDIIIQKALIVNQLGSDLCSQKINSNIIEYQSSPKCNANYEDSSFDFQTIELLGDTLAEVSINIENDYVKKALNSGLDDSTVKAYRDNLKAKCSELEKTNYINSICTKVSIEDDEEKPVSRYYRDSPSQPRRSIYLGNSYGEIEKESTLSIFWSEFGQGLMSETPNLIDSYIGYKDTQFWRDSTVSQIQTTNRMYLATAEERAEQIAWINEQRMLPPTDYSTLQPVGYQFGNTESSSQSTFQASNINSLYTNQLNPVQFNLPGSINVIDAAPQSTTGEGIGFTFNQNT